MLADTMGTSVEVKNTGNKGLYLTECQANPILKCCWSTYYKTLTRLSRELSVLKLVYPPKANRSEGLPNLNYK